MTFGPRTQIEGAAPFMLIVPLVVAWHDVPTLKIPFSILGEPFSLVRDFVIPVVVVLVGILVRMFERVGEWVKEAQDASEAAKGADPHATSPGWLGQLSDLRIPRLSDFFVAVDVMIASLTTQLLYLFVLPTDTGENASSSESIGSSTIGLHRPETSHYAVAYLALTFLLFVTVIAVHSWCRPRHASSKRSRRAMYGITVLSILLYYGFVRGVVRD